MVYRDVSTPRAANSVAAVRYHSSANRQFPVNRLKGVCTRTMVLEALATENRPREESS
jgi:hypothetical protein